MKELNGPYMANLTIELNGLALKVLKSESRFCRITAYLADTVKLILVPEFTVTNQASPSSETVAEGL